MTSASGLLCAAGLVADGVRLSLERARRLRSGGDERGGGYSPVDDAAGGGETVAGSRGEAAEAERPAAAAGAGEGGGRGVEEGSSGSDADTIE